MLNNYQKRLEKLKKKKYLIMMFFVFLSLIFLTSCGNFNHPLSKFAPDSSVLGVGWKSKIFKEANPEGVNLNVLNIYYYKDKSLSFNDRQKKSDLITVITNMATEKMVQANFKRVDKIKQRPDSKVLFEKRNFISQDSQSLLAKTIIHLPAGDSENYHAFLSYKNYFIRLSIPQSTEINEDELTKFLMVFYNNLKKQNNFKF